MNEQLLFQLFVKTMETYGAKITFDACPPLDPAFWAELTAREQTREQAALEQIALCLRRNTTDFDCVDEIVRILEGLGYSTVPRHDFG